MVVNMSNGLQQTFALQMRKQLNPIVPDTIKQIVENRIQSQNEAGRFDTIKFSKMLNMPVENEEEGLNFEERLELKNALNLMASSIKETIESVKAIPKNMKLAKEGEAYYKDILSRFDDDKDYVMIDNKELNFGLKDQMSAETRNTKEYIARMKGESSGIEGKSLVRRSTVAKALENVRKSMDGLRKDGINSYHKFNENGYRYGADCSNPGQFEEGVSLFEKVLPKLVDDFESFFRKGAELSKMAGSGEDFESETASRISALEDFLADLEFVEEDFSPRYRLPEFEEDGKTIDKSEMEKSAKLLVEMLKKYDIVYGKKTSTSIEQDLKP